MLAFLSGFKIFEHVIMPVRLSLERLIAFQKICTDDLAGFWYYLKLKLKPIFTFS